MKTYLCRYQHKGQQWGFEIKAESQEDAEERLQRIGAWGKVDGELVARIPAVVGPAVPLFVSFRNWLYRLCR